MTTLTGGQEGPPQAERAAPARSLTARLDGRPGPARAVALASGVRLTSLDVWRGLAVLFMVVDHVALLTPVPDALRLVPGRAAMPLFFLIAGALVTRLTWRHLDVAIVGLLLPLAVPWIDDPNVLVWWALGCATVVAMRRLGVPLWWPVVLVLMAHANGWGGDLGGSYEPVSLLALMCLGAMLPLSTWGSGAVLGPRRVRDALAFVGRHPLAFYVGHVLLLTALLVVAP